MGSQEYIVSLDIGTSKVRVIIGQMQSNSVQMVGVGSADAEGIKKGSIVDIDQTVESIKRAVEQAEQMVDIAIRELYVGVTGNHIELMNSHGVVAVSSEDREIGDMDIERVMQASQVVALPPDREIIDIVPQQFIVDGLGEIRDPKGMIGVRLEVDAQIITSSKTWIHNLSRCIERAGLSVSGYVLMPLAAGEIALTRDERHLGVVLLDMGAGATTISVFEGGEMTGTRSLPVGGDFITNDIAVGFRTSFEVAERIKVAHGQALISEAQKEIRFKVPGIGNQEEKEYSQYDLANIIEPRVEEIFELVRQEVENMVKTELAGGYVLIGGVGSLPGVCKVGQAATRMPVRLAKPDFIGFKDPSYVNGSGMILYIARHYNRGFTTNQTGRRASGKQKGRRGQGKRTFERVKNWLSEFI